MSRYRCTALLPVSQRCTIDESLRDVQLCCKVSQRCTTEESLRDVQLCCTFPREVRQRKIAGLYCKLPRAELTEGVAKNDSRASLQVSESRFDGGVISNNCGAPLQAGHGGFDGGVALNRHNCRTSLKSFPRVA